jgi:Ca-activated chloride channel family protein
MPGTPNYYDLLKIPKDAGTEEIRHAYHELARVLHPDKNPNKGATDQFLSLQTAYETLADPVRRIAYDKKLKKESDDPIQVDISYSRQRLSVQQESQLMYVLLEVTPTPKLAERPNPHLNLCLVLDRSTSMHGARMDTVKSAAIELIRQTTPEDIISIVAFGDRADVLVKAGKSLDRHFMETQIQMMRDGGGTEIFQGLEAGFLEVQRHLNRTMVNHVFMITDGHTYGDEASCLQLADRAALQGVRITGLGIGTEWNDKFLDELTSRTGGGSFFIAKNNDLHTFMQEKFKGLNQVFAERVTLSVDTPPGVILSTLFRVQPDSAILPLSNNIRLGSIQKTSGLTLLMEFIIPSVKEDTLRFSLATGELNLVLPFDAAATRKLPLVISRLTGEFDEKEMPPPALFQALTQLTLYRMQDKASQEASEGKVQQASLRLQRLATQLFSLGQLDLAQTALMEADRIQQTHMLSAEGEKAIKYGTRSFLLPARAREV